MNKFHFIQSIIASNFTRLTFPFKLSFAVTYKCNLRCRICNIWQKPASADELTSCELDRFFSQAHDFSWISLTGGEPFLRTDLPQIVSRILKYCTRLNTLHFATNGTLLPEIKKVLKAARKQNSSLTFAFTVSLDGPSGMHDALRGVPGTWEKAMETFIYLKNIGPQVRARFNFTLNGWNMDKFPAMWDAAKTRYPALSFEDLSVNVFQKSDFFYDNPQAPDIAPNEILQAISSILLLDKGRFSANNFLRKTYLKLNKNYLDTNKSPLACKALSSSCFLDPCGNLYPCVMFNKKFGNIKNSSLSLARLWQSEAAKQLRTKCVNNHCPSCWSPCDAYSAIAGSLWQAYCKARNYASFKQ
ncbi:MAG: radical SAM protein [Candidatus Omnitrophota bacterium]